MSNVETNDAGAAVAAQGAAGAPEKAVSKKGERVRRRARPRGRRGHGPRSLRSKRRRLHGGLRFGREEADVEYLMAQMAYLTARNGLRANTTPGNSWSRRRKNLNSFWWRWRSKHSPVSGPLAVPLAGEAGGRITSSASPLKFCGAHAGFPFCFSLVPMQTEISVHSEPRGFHLIGVVTSRLP